MLAQAAPKPHISSIFQYFCITAQIFVCMEICISFFLRHYSLASIHQQDLASTCFHFCLPLDYGLKSIEKCHLRCRLYRAIDCLHCLHCFHYFKCNTLLFTLCTLLTLVTLLPPLTLLLLLTLFKPLSLCKYNRLFHKNQDLEIHIAQCLFLVLGPIETDVRKCFAPPTPPTPL